MIQILLFNKYIMELVHYSLNPLPGQLLLHHKTVSKRNNLYYSVFHFLALQNIWGFINVLIIDEFHITDNGTHKSTLLLVFKDDHVIR